MREGLFLVSSRVAGVVEAEFNKVVIRFEKCHQNFKFDWGGLGYPYLRPKTGSYNKVSPKFRFNFLS